MGDPDCPYSNCSYCSKWRTKAFDKLPYAAWHEKGAQWRKLGRRQQKCTHCGLWSWIRKRPSQSRPTPAEGDKQP